MRFEMIDNKKKMLDTLRTLHKSTMKSLRKNMLAEWIYNSNAIEGNPLTMLETKVMLEDKTIDGESMREHLEVINHRDAILFLEGLIKKGEQLSEWNIRNTHRLVFKRIDEENAGVYRSENVIISGVKHRPPEHYLIKEQMEILVERNNKDWWGLHPIERASLLHSEFVRIHPFTDGNGRTAKLLLNFELMKNGFPLAIIKKEMRLKYYDSLDLARTTGDYNSFMNLIAQCVEHSLDLWLSVLI